MLSDGTEFIVGIILGVILGVIGAECYWKDVPLSKEAFAKCEQGELHLLDWNRYECRYEDQIVTFKVGE